ncbi:MAG: hypothetical protein CM15mP106_5670 [Candidatus Neomarinimicrobiota bacterium]|nr:MAG: hypothetical protein CM15mP106_5670 [Candidatus Neomarinimicrobiota bacterium]
MALGQKARTMERDQKKKKPDFLNNQIGLKMLEVLRI